MEDNIFNNWDIDLITSSQSKLDFDVLDLSMAIEKVFEHPKDKIVISVSEFLLELPLCYCFSDLLDDFLNLIKDISVNDKGYGVYGFSQNETFDADWILEWKDDFLDISFEWRRVNVDMSLESLPKKINLSRSYFLSSWKDFFDNLFNIIEESFLEDKTEYNLIKGLLFVLPDDASIT